MRGSGDRRSLVLIQSPELMPITQGLYQFFSRSSVRWPELMAASTVAAAIPVMLFVAVQRHIVQGLTAGAVKT
ncbi:MAG: carbohydrate ABC transporter permease [Limnochordaceae bacterium]|nr:carbohydrate ABC transporter permease [Limnochordaceae bacterium]